MVSNRRGLGSDVSGWLPPAVIQRREIPPPPAFAFVLPNVLDLRSVAATGPVPSIPQGLEVERRSLSTLFPRFGHPPQHGLDQDKWERKWTSW